MMQKKAVQVMLFIKLVVTTAADFTSQCPQECRCFWSNGNKEADCFNSNFHEIPKTLSTDIQILNLTDNSLKEIPIHAFEEAQLINLKKLILRNCQILAIHKSGLSGLSIMIELDLSRNDLQTLHADTFKETAKIIWILLNDNKLEKLEDGLFSDLAFLQKVDLSNNRIYQIGLKTFVNVPKLNHLRLDGNKLEFVKLDALGSVTSLSTLDIADNPWRCDCYLQPFTNWVISKNLSKSPVTCSEPTDLHGKLWTDLDSSNFVCQPIGIFPTTSTIYRTTGTNVTLSCQVDGNHLPDLSWVLNSQNQGEVKYYITQSSNENGKYLNLTIVETGSTDSGK